MPPPQRAPAADRTGRPAAPHREIAGWRFGELLLAPLSSAETTRWIVERALEKSPAVVVTSNVHHLRLAERDRTFRDVVRRAELNVADGWPLVLASRILGGGIPGRVAGIDLVDDLLHSDERLRVAILGGPGTTAARLAEMARDHHDVVLVDPLPPQEWEQRIERLTTDLRSAAPTLVLLGIGAPRQELLAESLRPAVRGPIVCCGAAIEVLAGLRPRAPETLQRLGLEWAWRIALEPSRLLPRYLLAASSFIRVVGRETFRTFRRSLR